MTNKNNSNNKQDIIITTILYHLHQYCCQAEPLRSLDSYDTNLLLPVPGKLVMMHQHSEWQSDLHHQVVKQSNRFNSEIDFNSFNSDSVMTFNTLTPNLALTA